MLSFLLLGILLAGQGGEAMSAREAAARDLAEAERAFAKTALESGVRTAFLKWLEPGATIFRPEPIDGPEFHRASEASPALLIWEPALVDVAASLDLGLSTGPWKYQVDAGSASVAFGHFISVWRRQPDESWRVVADIGVNCDAADARFGAEVSLASGPEAEPTPHELETEASIDIVDAGLRSEGALAHPPLDPQVRLYRLDHGPVLGVAAARELLIGEGAALLVTRVATVQSADGDFAATWGTERGAGVEADLPGFSFLRVWRRADTGNPWLLRLEVRLPLAGD